MRDRRPSAGCRRSPTREIEALSDVLIDCVEGGASVSFMLPLSRAKAAAFWRGAGRQASRAASARCWSPRTRRAIVGTVQLILAQPENQPHRADLAKMLVHRRARRRGVGAALLRPPSAARERGQDAAGARHRDRRRCRAPLRAAGLAARAA